MALIKLVSVEDSSVNYVKPASDGGFFESRFVQRDPSYLIVYLSSHSGCNQGCKFCHLTQTSQTKMKPAQLDDYVDQAINVLSQVDFVQLKEKGLKKVKFSFMARGEPLLNPTLKLKWNELRHLLKDLVPSEFGVEFCISTIYPKSFNKDLRSIFDTDDVVIYYSFYSANKDFRSEWLPHASSYEKALESLAKFQKDGGRVKIHSAFIKGENDLRGFAKIDSEVLKKYLGTYNFNIVRYNPYSPLEGEESENLVYIAMMHNAKIVTRVGKDVKASCGMFYNKDI